MALTDNLISFWRLDEASGTRVDSHGSNDLTDNSTVTTEDGIIGGSLNFLYDSANFVDTNSESLSRADNAGLSTGDIDFFIAGWFKLNATLLNHGLVGKSSSTNKEWKLGCSSANQLYFQIYDSGASSVGLVQATSYGNLTVGQWVYICAWHDEGVDTVNIQLDNGTVDSSATTGTPSDTATSFYIGYAFHSGAMNYLNGAAQMVGFWKRIPTSNERTQLWNGGMGLDYPFTDALFTDLGTAVATDGYAKNRHNATYAQSQVQTQWETGGTTYEAIVYWNDDTTPHLVIGKRVAAGAWTLYTYDGGGGLATITLSDDDPHDRAAIGIDPNGYIHACYDMHNDALNYRKSDAAINSWTGTLGSEISMLGTNESSVSYPTFFNDPSGTLYFMFRDGTPDDGDTYFYEYDESGPSWGSPTGLTAGKLIDGKTSGDSAYHSAPPVFDTDFGSGGYMHNAAVWVDTAATNRAFDLFYVKWDGTNWEQADGTGQTIPITPSNDEVVDAVASGNGLSNFQKLDSDSSGNPHMAYYKDDGSANSQIYYVYHNGSSWSGPLALTSQSDFTYLQTPVRDIPAVVVNRTLDTVYIIYSGFGEVGGVFYQYSNDFSNFTKATLTSTVVGNWAVNYNRQTWTINNALQMAVFGWNAVRADQQNIRVFDGALATPLSVNISPGANYIQVV